MEQISKLPIDFETWKQLGYDASYSTPISPLDVVANSAIKFYKNQLNQLNLTEENRDIIKESISRIRNLVNYKI